MTCIVGIVQDNVVYMGGDSAETTEDFSMNQCYDKVFLRGEFIYGYSGDSRFCQLVEFCFEPPPITEPLDAYMVSTWVNALRTCLLSGGYLSKTNNKEEIDGNLLIGVRGRLFHLWGDFACVEYCDNYGAVGCAYQIALGSLHSTKGTPKKRIETALKAAERYNASVRSPFVIKELKC